MSEKVFLSIVIPAFNEEKNYRRGVLSQVDEYLKRKEYVFEILIIDDGSTDATYDLVFDYVKNKKKWRLIHLTHQGKFKAIKTGILKARGKYILFTDFDQSTPLSEVEKLLETIKEGNDIVIGSREAQGAKREKEPFYRHLMGRIFNLIVKVITSLPFEDTQCGFKLFKATAIQAIVKEVKVAEARKVADAYTGAFDVEILFLAKKRGYRVREVPVNWRHFESKRVQPLKDSLRMLIDVLKIKICGLKGEYDQI